MQHCLVCGTVPTLMQAPVQAVFLLPMFFLGILSLGVMIVAFATKGLSGSSVRGPTLLHQLEAILFSSHEADQTQAQERLEEML